MILSKHFYESNSELDLRYCIVNVKGRLKLYKNSGMKLAQIKMSSI